MSQTNSALISSDNRLRPKNSWNLRAQSCPQKSNFGTFLSIVNPLRGAPPKYKLQYKPGVKDALVHM